MADQNSYSRHHYVPQWYQYRFFDGTEKEKKFYYLDLKPDTIRIVNGKKIQRKSLLKWGPPRCFYQDDLYTTRFGEWSSKEIEEKFFGKIDFEAQAAVDYFSTFQHPSAHHGAFQTLLPYMSVQKLRTPKGIGYLRDITNSPNKNATLLALQRLHRMHCALWTECVWSIVDAAQSEIKFIISDNPVTVYNLACYPESKWCRGINDPGIWLDGTQTIFPLSFDKALILTNLSWVRNPYGSPLKERPHSILFRPAMFNFTGIQTGRILAAEEVASINYIIKKRAFRYIASAREEWLYPERVTPVRNWNDIGKSYLLMPDPRSVSFSSEIIIGYGDGSADAFDEYGRRPWNSDYREQDRHDLEWHSFHAFQAEYARKYGPKRKGRSYEFGHVTVEDSEEYHSSLLRSEQYHKSRMRRMKK